MLPTPLPLPGPPVGPHEGDRPILPITVLSAAVYLLKGYVSLSDAYVYLPGGIIGAFLGTVILRKISPLWLKRIFGIFMLYAGVRLLIK